MGELDPKSKDRLVAILVILVIICIFFLSSNKYCNLEQTISDNKFLGSKKLMHRMPMMTLALNEFATAMKDSKDEDIVRICKTIKEDGYDTPASIIIMVVSLMRSEANEHIGVKKLHKAISEIVCD